MPSLRARDAMQPNSLCGFRATELQTKRKTPAGLNSFSRTSLRNVSWSSSCSRTIRLKRSDVLPEIISGHVSLLLHKFGRESAEGQKLQIVEEAAGRAAGLTRQLLAYSRKQVLEPKMLEIDPLVKTLESMLRRLIREDIELRTELNGRDARVKVDPNQLEQVLINLAVNARDAMPEGGLLLIRTERPPFLPRHQLPSPAGGDSYVVITVSD